MIPSLEVLIFDDDVPFNGYQYLYFCEHLQRLKLVACAWVSRINYLCMEIGSSEELNQRFDSYVCLAHQQKNRRRHVHRATFSEIRSEFIG